MTLTFLGSKGIWSYSKSEYMTDLASNWEDEKEMNRELSKLCKELGYTVIDEHIDNNWVYDDGRRGNYEM